MEIVSNAHASDIINKKKIVIIYVLLSSARGKYKLNWISLQSLLGYQVTDRGWNELDFLSIFSHSMLVKLSHWWLKMDTSSRKLPIHAKPVFEGAEPPKNQFCMYRQFPSIKCNSMSAIGHFRYYLVIFYWVKCCIDCVYERLGEEILYRMCVWANGSIECVYERMDRIWVNVWRMKCVCAYLWYRRFCWDSLIPELHACDKQTRLSNVFAIYTVFKVKWWRS